LQNSLIGIPKIPFRGFRGEKQECNKPKSGGDIEV
jgi:hypothetical protein